MLFSCKCTVGPIQCLKTYSTLQFADNENVAQKDRRYSIGTV